MNVAGKKRVRGNTVFFFWCVEEIDECGGEWAGKVLAKKNKKTYDMFWEVSKRG